MLATENLEINGETFVKTYSDVGCYIKRDGVKYVKLIISADIERIYTEIDESIETDEEQTEVEQKIEAFDYLIKDK